MANINAKKVFHELTEEYGIEVPSLDGENRIIITSSKTISTSDPNWKDSGVSIEIPASAYELVLAIIRKNSEVKKLQEEISEHMSFIKSSIQVQFPRIVGQDMLYIER